nr:ketopantoate reductase C-terminal domain-containing protein [Roseomonas acroporae]
MIVGAGGMGGLLAASMVRAGIEVLVLEPWAPNRAAIRSGGLRLERDGGRREVVPLAVHDRAEALDAARADVALLCVKLPEIGPAVAALEACYRGPYLVVADGLADLDLASLIGAERVMGCIVNGCAADLVAPGRIRTYEPFPARPPALFRLGEATGAATDRLAALAALFGRIAPTETVRDLVAARWSHLVLCSMIGPLAALNERPLRDLFLDAALRAEMLGLGLEAVATAAAAGIRLDPICGMPEALWRAALGSEAAPLEALEAGLLRAGARQDPRPLGCIMADLTAGRPTQLPFINGAVVRLARQHGVPVPANAAVMRRVLARTALSTPTLALPPPGVAPQASSPGGAPAAPAFR